MNILSVVKRGPDVIFTTPIGRRTFAESPLDWEPALPAIKKQELGGTALVIIEPETAFWPQIEGLLLEAGWDTWTIVPTWDVFRQVQGERGKAFDLMFQGKEQWLHGLLGMIVRHQQ